MKRDAPKPDLQRQERQYPFRLSAAAPDAGCVLARKPRHRHGRWQVRLTLCPAIADATSLRPTANWSFLAPRGAIGGLMVEVVEDHVRSHLVSRDPVNDGDAGEQLIETIRTYMR